MNITLEIITGAVSALALLPTTVLFTETLLSKKRPALPYAPEAIVGRVAVLVPAHDEAQVIATTLRSIVPQLRVGDRLLVVADNCLDDTAAVAATEGAEVIERKDAVRRGKGYALEFGIRHLERDAPGVLIVVDADCHVHLDTIGRLARQCQLYDRPAQALYLMQAVEHAGPLARLAQFAWAVKNQVRPLGLHRLGLPCQLMGTGMAFRWADISAELFATGHIVEDLKLGIDLARAGRPPRLCPEALVTSSFAASKRGARSQRTRWEHGYLAVALHEGPRLLIAALVRRDPGLVALSLDLCVPPLSLLALLVGFIWLADAILYVTIGSRLPLAVGSAAATFLLLSVLSAWARYGRQIVSLRTLMLAGAYALVKIPLYARFLWARQLDWVRADRDTERPSRRH